MQERPIFLWNLYTPAASSVRSPTRKPFVSFAPRSSSRLTLAPAAYEQNQSPLDESAGLSC
jgi:hypothetical protein